MDDPNLMLKFQAIKKSKKSKKQQLLDKILVYTFIAFTCSLLFSSPFWLPYLKDFLFISLPKMGSVIVSPKLLFLVGNIIVIVLIGESKIFASFSGSSISGDGYCNEYVDRSRSFGNTSTMELKKEMKMDHFRENLKGSCLVVSVTGRLVEDVREVKKKTNYLQGEHEFVLGPTEELKKRADDFIARVNRQRRLEVNKGKMPQPIFAASFIRILNMGRQLAV